jgi:8-amino-7-oxononanoate synthase
MNSSGRGGRLTGAQREALLASVKKAGAASSRPKLAPGEAAPAVDNWDVSFATLPGVEIMQMQRGAGDFLGLSDPFYRLHEIRAGAHSVIDGQPVLNFASYDYLGLNGHPAILEAVTQAVRDWGTSVSASRITAGERPFHRAFEKSLAEVYGAEDALLFVGGHSTNVSAIATILGPEDLILYDALSHNSIVVGADLSKATRRPFPHNDMEALAALLKTHRPRHKRCLIVSEGLFSMDGDAPDLARLIELKEQWGAWLMIDDAHALGVMGERGYGLAEHCGIDPARVDIWMGTLSKALVSCGGYIAGSKDLITYLKFCAPGQVYSVGMSAPATVAAHTALTLMQAEPERVQRLHANGRRFVEKARAAGLDIGTSLGFSVVPVIIGDSLRTVALAERLLQLGINAFPIIPPGVSEQSARLRFFISASHEPEELDRAVATVASELETLVSEGISVAAVAALFS